MASGIDFLQSKKEKVFRKAKFLQLLRIASLVILVAYCLLVAAVSSFWIYTRQEDKRVTALIANKKNRVNELKKTESLQIMLKQRLTLLEKFFSTKNPNYAEVITYLEEISPVGITFKDLELTDEGKVYVTGMAVNAVTLGDFLEKITSKTPESKFINIVLSGITRRKDAAYDFGLYLETYEKS